MILKILLHLVTVMVAIEAAQETVTIPPEAVPVLGQTSLDCVAKTGLDQDALQKLLEWKIEDTENVRKFIYCFATGSGYADRDGHFVVDKMVKLIGNHKSKSEFEKVLHECNKIKGKDKKETMFKSAMCFNDKSPLRFTLS